ncbi:MAG TPA: 50S ribosomal protein L21 [Thermotogota bacterium]|nr:50S ribosomal protein L21 [Thermotogota bacterium]HRW91910.1 50S ribosomal protein L21 [Thermotogota bacterium]
MYAIIETSGRQYRVEEGNVLYTEKQNADAGDVLVFDKVVFVRSDDGVFVGKPFVEGASVKATVVEHVREKKVRVVKFGSRKMYRRTKGHRQWQTALKIEQITREE